MPRKLTYVKKGGIAAVSASVLAVAIVAWYVLARPSGSESAGAAQPPLAIPVLAANAETRTVPVYVRGIGTVQAYNTVTVRTRVDGQIQQVLFTEGDEVKAGDRLFQIDPRPFQAALDQAVAAKQRDEAQLEGAQRDLERYSKLLTTGFQTRQSYDDQKAQVGGLQGSVKADQAAIENAKLNLVYADIRSPIAGRTGARLVDIGNFVQSSQGTALVTITQIKPIYVSFTVPQDTLDVIRRNQAEGPLDVDAYASDDKTRLAQGKLSLIDNHVDTTTGTIQLKATFANADERLWPGEFVSARLVLALRKNAVTVPAETVMQGAKAPYIYVIGRDDRVERREVSVAAVQDGIAVIAHGVTAGERVVVDGQYRLTNGATVKIDKAAQSAAED